MLVREWMTEVLVTIRPDASIIEAERLMRHRRIRHLPVIGGDRLAGIITDRDVRTAMPSPATTLAAGEVSYLLDRLRVDHVMSRPVVTIHPEAPVTEAVARLLAHRIGALPVVDQGQLAGIITETDLLRAFAHSCASCAAAPAPGATAGEAADRQGVPCPARAAGRPAILVPLDGSPGSESVLATVGDLARAHGARVRLLRVVPEARAVTLGDRFVAYADQETERAAAETLDYLRSAGHALPGIEAEPIVRFGDPVEAIVREARQADVGLVAMATHRRRGLDRLRNGSVAEAVERAAGVPVVLVPYGPGD